MKKKKLELSKIGVALVAVLLLAGSVTNSKNSLCIFESYESCLQNEECCQVRVHNDYLCLNKQFLYENYKMRYEEQFKEIKDDDGELLFDYKFKNNACIKWMEINKPLYSDINIEYNCQCESQHALSTLALGLLLLLLGWACN